jgi:hypothetical protein
MAATVPGVPNPIRFENVVENYRALQKTKPEFTFEYGLKSMLTIFTLHDFSMFHMGQAHASGAAGAPSGRGSEAGRSHDHG